MAIDSAGFLRGEQKLACNLGNDAICDLQRSFDSRDGELADKVPMRLDEGGNRPLIRSLAGEIGHINREEIARLHKEVHVAQADVVRIDMIAARPTQRLDGGIGFGPDLRGQRADEGVLAMRFVPDRGDVNPLCLRANQRRQLRFSLMRESITHS